MKLPSLIMLVPFLFSSSSSLAAKLYSNSSEIRPGYLLIGQNISHERATDHRRGQHNIKLEATWSYYRAHSITREGIWSQERAHSITGEGTWRFAANWSHDRTSSITGEGTLYCAAVPFPMIKRPITWSSALSCDTVCPVMWSSSLLFDIVWPSPVIKGPLL